MERGRRMRGTAEMAGMVGMVSCCAGRSGGGGGPYFLKFIDPSENYKIAFFGNSAHCLKLYQNLSNASQYPSNLSPSYNNNNNNNNNKITTENNTNNNTNVKLNNNCFSILRVYFGEKKCAISFWNNYLAMTTTNLSAEKITSPIFSRGSQMAIIVYDVSIRSEFIMVGSINNLLLDRLGENCYSILLIAVKNTLVERVVSISEGEAKAREMGGDYFEVDFNDNSEDKFQLIVEKIIFLVEEHTKKEFNSLTIHPEYY